MSPRRGPTHSVPAGAGLCPVRPPQGSGRGPACDRNDDRDTEPPPPPLLAVFLSSGGDPPPLIWPLLSPPLALRGERDGAGQAAASRR